jgi:hypothetical protein
LHCSPVANRRALRSGETLEVECTDGATSDEATPKKRKLSELKSEKMKRRKEQEYSAALALTEIVASGGSSQAAQPKGGK